MSGITVTSSTMTADQMAQNFDLDEAQVETPETPPAADTPADAPPQATDIVQEQVSVPTDTESASEPERERHVSRAQQRVNQVLREKKLAELELEKERTEKKQLADEIAKLKATPPPAPPEPPTPPQEAAPAQPEAIEDPEPKEDDFTDWNEFQRAIAKWEGRQEARRLITEERARDAKAREQFQLQRQRMDQAQAYVKRAETAKTVYTDFDAVVNRDVPLHPVMGEVILTSEAGPELAYHFGTHPDDAARIRALPPAAMLTEMHRLEGRLSALRDLRSTPPPAAPIPPVPISSAPPPPPGLPAGTVVTMPTTRTAKTFKEFEEAERREQEAKRQRG